MISHFSDIKIDEIIIPSGNVYFLQCLEYLKKNKN